MKTTLLTLIVLTTTCSALRSQEKYVWIKLNDSRVIINGKFHGLSGDSLIVESGMKRIELPLSDVARMRVINESGILEGALFGGAIGLVTGAALGFLTQSNATEGQSPMSTAVIFTVVGGVVGTVKSAFEKPEPIVDLQGKSVQEKRRIVESLIEDKQENITTQ